MAAYKNIALVGASGSIGKIILQGLIESSSFNITVLSRKDSEITFPAGVTVYKTDFSESDLKNAFAGQDVVISALGAAGLEHQKKIADAAIGAGVQRFLPSEFSSSSQDETVLQLLPIFGQKSTLIDYLKAKESETFSWTGVATSGLFDWGLANGFLGFDIENHTATIWDGGHKSFTLTNEKDLGLAVVSVLKNPQDTKNRYLYVASVETTQKDILKALEDTTRKSWTVKETSTKEQIDEATEKLNKGDFGGALILVRATCFGSTPGLRSNYAKDETLANETLGVVLGTVEDTVKRVVSQ